MDSAQLCFKQSGCDPIMIAFAVEHMGAACHGRWNVVGGWVVLECASSEVNLALVMATRI